MGRQTHIRITSLVACFGSRLMLRSARYRETCLSCSGLGLLRAIRARCSALPVRLPRQRSARRFLAQGAWPAMWVGSWRRSQAVGTLILSRRPPLQ